MFLGKSGSTSAHGSSETQKKRPIQASNPPIGQLESDLMRQIDTIKGFEPRSSVVCPLVFAYDRAFQARLADEVQRLPPGAALERAMLDYARLRDQARA